MTVTLIHPQGNKREVPPGVPTGLWLDDMRQIIDLPETSELPWVHPVMEYLDPALLRRFRAQAIVWRWYTGDYPGEVAWWWPVRLGRRPVCPSCNNRQQNDGACTRCGTLVEPGPVPHMTEVSECYIDSSGVLHCGFCGARWSSNHDGSPHADRCSLCDRIQNVVRDEREELCPK